MQIYIYIKDDAIERRIIFIFPSGSHAAHFVFLPTADSLKWYINVENVAFLLILISFNRGSGSNFADKIINCKYDSINVK